MQASNRIIVNTIAQYIRTIINTFLSLYSSRLVLSILGIGDYGIYALIAGVVSLLSFFTNSLVGSTLRYLSVTQGKNDISELKRVFSNSLILHVFIGLLIAVVLILLIPFIFNGFLNIKADRLSVAVVLYKLVVWMVYISFVSAPYRALLFSRENIVYISIIDVIDGFLKVLMVLFLPFIPFDKLLAYGWIMMLISLFNFLAFMIYSSSKYEECILPRLDYFRYSYIKELAGYTGWIIYSTFSVGLKMQGLAVILNKSLGTAVNAAYGIGQQIAGMISFISTSFSNAVAPQLMAATGEGDRNRMWLLSTVESKFSFLLLAMLGIPTMFELESLLGIWLVEVPKHAVLFGCMFLITQIIDMLSTGLSLVNKALGNIGRFTFITYTPKLLVLPLGWISLHLGFDLLYIALIMITIETFCMLLRVYLFRTVKGFSASEFCKEVIIRCQFPVIITSILCYMFCSYFNFMGRLLITYVLAIFVFVFLSYYMVLNSIEKQFLKSLLDRVFKYKLR